MEPRSRESLRAPLPMLPACIAADRYVHVQEIADIFTPGSRRERAVPWHEGLTPLSLLPGDWDPALAQLAINGAEMPASAWTRPLRPGVAVTFLRAPGAGITLAGVLWSILISTAFSYALRLIQGPPDSREPQNDASSTYGWSGPYTNYVANGMPIPVIYGGHIAGGAAIMAFVDVENTTGSSQPKSYLYLIILVSLGTIDSIGGYTEDAGGLTGNALPEGMLINGNSAENYDDVTAYVRLGSLDQDTIPAFQVIAVPYYVDLPVTQLIEDIDPAPVVLDWDEAATYNMPAGETADRAKIHVLFPSGLYALYEGSTVITWSVQAQVRYQEIDENDVPFGNAVVTTGNGTITISGKSTDPFTFQIEFPFNNPDTSQAPQLSNGVSFSSTGIAFGGGGPFVPSNGALPWPIAGAAVWQTPSAPIEEISITCFLTGYGSGPDDWGPFVSIADWNQSEADPRVKGLMLYTLDYQLHVTWGDGIGALDETATLSVDLPLIVTTTDILGLPFTFARLDPVFVTLTYQRNAIAGQNRMRLYINGALAGEKLSAVECLVTDYSSLLVHSLPHKENDTTPVKWASFVITYDELKLYDTELTAARVASLHNDGIWIQGTAVEPDLVVGFHFDLLQTVGIDDVSPSYFPAPDSHRITVQGVTDVLEGVSLIEFGNPIKRGRYQVKLLRASKTSTLSAYIDEFRFDDITLITDQDQSHPGCALLGLKILATDQLHGNSPNITVPVKGINTCPVWDGVDAEKPSFTPQYSASPHWQLAHLMLNKDFGAGSVYNEKRIDWQSVKLAADYSAELVYDQRERRGGVDDELELDYMASGAGMPGEVYVLRVAKPISSHHVAGKAVRLDSLTDPAPAGEYAGGGFVIGVVKSISTTEYEIWLDWPEGLAVPATQPLEDATALLVGVEPRHESHLVLGDRGLPFLEARQLFAGLGRAAVVSVGDKVSIFQHRPRQPVAFFNASNIVKGSFKLSSSRSGDRFNSAAAEFQDAGHGYQRNVVQRDHASLQDPNSTTSVRRKVFDFRGLTAASQAHRELQYHLNVNFLITLAVEFDVGSDGIFLLPGEVFGLAHPLPSWSTGGRLAQGSSDASSIYPDTTVIMGTLNMLERVNDMGHAVWAKAADAGSPPTVDFTAVAGPDGELVADQLTFPSASTNPTISQGLPNRGPGFEVTETVWLRLVSGPADKLILDAVSATETLASVVPALTSQWARFTVTGTSTKPTSSDPTINWQLRLDPTAGADVVVEVCRQRSVVGDDDLLDAVDEEAVVDHEVHHVAVVNPNQGNAVSWVPAVASAGRWAPGERIDLAAPLDWSAGNGWLWFVGPLDYGTKLFAVTSITQRSQHTAHIQGVEYDENVFPDEDAFEVAPLAVPQSELTSQKLSPHTLPGLPTSLSVTEQASRDEGSGTLRTALVVSWSPNLATLHLLRSNRLWVRESGGGDWELAAEVAGNQTFHRLEALSLRPGLAYTVAVQPVTRSGVATPISRARKASALIVGVFPPPRAPVDVRASLSGDSATYEIDLPANSPAAAVEIYRGGTFVGQEVGRIPAGGAVLGPTTDWCVLPAASDGRQSPPLYARLVLANGSRGDFTRLDAELVPQGFGVPVAEASAEDGPWDEAGAVLDELTRFVSAIEGRPDRLQFDAASEELSASYTSPVIDLGRARRVHVSAGLVGQQLPPINATDTTAPVSSLRNRTWTPQGHLDPGHPSYGRLGVHLEWVVSESAADPGSAYQPFRCGVALVRSCRFRIRIERPSVRWDVWVERFAYSLRPVPVLALSDWQVTA